MLFLSCVHSFETESFLVLGSPSFSLYLIKLITHLQQACYSTQNVNICVSKHFTVRCWARLFTTHSMIAIVNSYKEGSWLYQNILYRFRYAFDGKKLSYSGASTSSTNVMKVIWIATIFCLKAYTNLGINISIS